MKLYVISFTLFLFGACNRQEMDTDIQEAKAPKFSIGKTSSKISYSGIVDFKNAARIATPGVVHIKSTLMQENIQEGELQDPFKEFFKNDPFFRHFDFESPSQTPMQTGGSGVIVTSNGYIVTNNHVVRKADKIEVTLSDSRSYEARVVGADPQTDIALIKIEEEELSFIEFGDSDSIEVGDWVVAVGNPFNLASTVTAGIVSAKARTININRAQGAIESFIQTDAAVNAGNSGGALVDLDGKLIGINTAIATPTGTYAGYAFAISSNITRKVVNDLLNYGKVKRAYLGVVIQEMNKERAEELKTNYIMGIYIHDFLPGSAAKKSGLKEKDIIIKINDTDTPTIASLQEAIARKNPGDKVIVTLIRNGKQQEIPVILD